MHRTVGRKRAKHIRSTAKGTTQPTMTTPTQKRSDKSPNRRAKADSEASLSEKSTGRAKRAVNRRISTSTITASIADRPFMPSRTPSHVCLKKPTTTSRPAPDEKAEAVKSAGTSGVLRNGREKRIENARIENNDK